MEPLEVNELERENTPAETERPVEEAAAEQAEPEPAQLEEIITAEMIVEAPPGPDEDAQFKALIEAAIYITDEPLTAARRGLAGGGGRFYDGMKVTWVRKYGRPASASAS